MFALISDIHSNLEALKAVLADMQAFPLDEVLCLGDVVGYGPNPRETLDLVRPCRFVLRGNHEEGMLEDTAQDFNARARRALNWTISALNSKEHPKEQNYALWDMLDSFEVQRAEGRFHFVHGSPRQPTREYILPADALDRHKMQENFALLKGQIAFGGHTHVPGLLCEGQLFRYQGDLEGKVPFPQGKCLINIGSVGQPRDGDNRACYVIVDGDTFMWRRVAYDFETTMKKIQAIPELDDFLGKRLKSGR